MPRVAPLVLYVFSGIALALALPDNARADDAPSFDFQSAGVQLRGPQFMYDAAFDIVDWNDDGRQDVFLLATGTCGGRINFNEGTADEPRFGHAVYWPFNTTETHPLTIEHVSSYTTCDLHGNGLFGFIFFDGELRYCPNTGTKHGPFYWNVWTEKRENHSDYFPGSERFLKENARFSTGPESMYWKKGIFPRQVLTLTAADWDGDGLQDLLICRFKDESPGVTDLGAHDPSYRREQWTAWGRTRTTLPTPAALAELKPEDHSAPLQSAPARGLYFYKNLGTPEKPHFDAGVEITDGDGHSIAAPNPVATDVDGDGVLDIVSSETAYRSNAFRVDWPTSPHVQWFRRPAKEATQLQSPQPLIAGGKPVPAGTMARLADFRQRGANDLFVLQPGGTLHWYRNRAKACMPLVLEAPIALRGTDFLRFEFMVQPVVVDWFGPGSRDLILHGCTDHHCKWDLRRTAIYRNVAKKPGEVAYEFAGYLNYRGDEALVPVALEERHYEVFGSSLAVFPDDGSGRKRVMVSVGGRLYLFSDLAPDGLTFQRMTPIDIPSVTNRHKGWQEIDLDVPDKVQYIRVSNDANGQGNLRDGFLHVLQFEALAGGKNVATADAVSIKKLNTQDSPYYQVQGPLNMFTPGNANIDTELKATSWGYYIGPAVITLKEPVKLDTIRFLLSDRDSLWYRNLVPFSWQGKVYRVGMEQGEIWYQYKVEVSADEKEWTVVADRLQTEILYSHPELIDWDRDGRVDLLLGVTTSNGTWPAFKTYRLYRNSGSNESPKYDPPQFCTNEQGEPLKLTADWATAYGAQCGIAARDLYGDGKPSLVVEQLEGGLAYYRNVSPDGKGLVFRHDQHFAKLNGQPITTSAYRFFDIDIDIDDVDGDGISDLIDSGFGTLVFYKGVAQGAPARTTDLEATGTNNGLTLRWTRPTGSTHYDVRWSTEPIDELNWHKLPGTVAPYRAAEGEIETASLATLPAGKPIVVALKSQNAAEQWSGISDLAEGVLSPLRRIVLRNGPAGTAGELEYAGNQGVSIRTTPAAAAGAAAAGASSPLDVLEVRSQDSNAVKGKESVILLRFADLNKLPKATRLERATVELVLEPSKNPAPMTTAAISCNSIARNWDTATANPAQARAGVPWAPRELEAGGTCQSFLRPVFATQMRRRTWDVTPAVRQAIESGQDQVNLLIRLDYTGHYVANSGLRFCGADVQAVGDRPRMVLLVR